VSVYREYAGCEVWIAPPPAGTMPPGVAVDEEDDDMAFLQSLNADFDDEPAGQASSVLELTEDDEVESPSASGAHDGGGSERDVSDDVPHDARDDDPADASATSTAAAAAARYATAQQAALTAVGAGGTCVFCDSRMPSGRRARFCPFCGGDQTMKPCPTCGEALEAGWIFCIACGGPAQPEET
jgi:hypothetical protein